MICDLDVWITLDAFNAMSSGCTINREMTLAVNNRKSTGKVELPANCYFSMAEFTDSRLIMRSGQEVRMTVDNSHLKNPWNSSIQSYEPTYDDSADEYKKVFRGDLTALNRTVRGDYVSDRCKGSISGYMPV